MQEQRGSPRLRVDLNVRWETLKSQGGGQISDLSASGCFVLTVGDAGPRELTRLQITSAQQVAVLWGQIVYVVNEIGFAVRFIFRDESDQTALNALLQELQG